MITSDWIVGFTEGEGCFRIERKKYPRFIIVSTEKDIIYQIKDFFGFGNVYVASHQTMRNNGIKAKDYYRYEIQNKKNCLKIAQFFKENPLQLPSKRIQFENWLGCLNR